MHLLGYDYETVLSLMAKRAFKKCDTFSDYMYIT